MKKQTASNLLLLGIVLSVLLALYQLAAHQYGLSAAWTVAAVLCGINWRSKRLRGPD